ncbi:acyl-CoA carboxylase epsilon subunit [Microbispora sp. NPDC049125]|uniref:acyl-CoA carboxylase epsilon subunit n=1 Tax=Microbispora sp. NPDC049125 TaxID=3154929 RepID=UPI003466675A
MLRVLSGEPTGEELCALLCALRLSSSRPTARPPAVTPRRQAYGYRSPRSWSTPRVARG